MRLSELCIRRPVFATVMTLLLVVFGILSFHRLSLREYPAIEPPIVSVRTIYSGADAELVETNVTTVLEDALSGIEGLKTLTSNSREEMSSVTLEFDLGRDLDAAANDVRDRVSRARRQLPRDIEEPIVVKEDADADEILWLALSSDRHSELDITETAERAIKSRLAVLPGVSTVYLDGERRYAMRVWLDPDRLAARQLTVEDVEEGLRNQNVTLPSGRIESDRLEYGVSTRGMLHTPEQFNDLIMAYRDGYPVRLRDVGRVELGAEDDRKLVRVNGKPAVGLGVVKQSKANTLEVARAVKRELLRVIETLPEGMALRVAFDSSVAIERSIREVHHALGWALGLVILVIFLFLGSARATLIPAVAIPASLVGGLTVLYAAGSSLNVLTLLGLVLAVGLVVDDAIIMLENIHRRLVRGVPSVRAAIDGSREIGFAVVATTLSLVAVFVPVAFLTGMVGRLFAELAIAVAGSVLLSGFIALTLTPMLCATMLTPASRRGWLHRAAETALAAVSAGYRRALAAALRTKSVVLAAALGSAVAGLLLFMRLPSELAPLEDTGWFVVHLLASEGATIRQTDTYARRLEDLYATVPEIATTYTVVGRGGRPTVVNRAASWASLIDWDERSRAQREITAALTPRLAELGGVKAYLIDPPPMNQSANRTPVQFVIGGTSYEDLKRTAGLLVQRAAAHPGLIDLDTDLVLDKPHVAVEVRRAKAADLGVSVSAIGRTLESLLGGRPVTTFVRDGRAYNVIVKVDDRRRGKPSDIGALHVRGNDQALIPLDNLVDVREHTAPQALRHYDKMRAVTLSAGLADGFTLGEALDYLDRLAKEVLPPGMRISYAGESKELKEAGSGLAATFALALLVIYLVLAAQFDSYVHPFTILLAVPPAVMGALLALKLTGGTLNIYSQIGLVMLIGLVSKNSILIVEFANQLRTRGRDVVAAVIEAAALRLRPILMTTVATILGAVPLALAFGAGAEGRRQIGIVVIGGLAVSTLLTLFVVPAVYMLLAGRSEEDRMPSPDTPDLHRREPRVSVPVPDLTR
ncbi:MAG: efflux RND transporter permease subunit [Nitrospirota bacterium]